MLFLMMRRATWVTETSQVTLSILRKLKLKNVNKLVIGHLNIDSLPGKLD